MIRLSRTVEYAVQALLLLAKADRSEPIPCSQLATAGAMPQRFLLQVLRSLVLHEVVSSTRGVEGGYSLARDPEQITLLDVFEAIEGPVISSSRCNNHMPAGLQTTLHNAFQAAGAAMSQRLAAVSLTQLLAAQEAYDSAPSKSATHTPLPINGPDCQLPTIEGNAKAGN
jgi:Rrf2 family protein